MKLNVKQRVALRTIFKPDSCSIAEQDLYDELLSKIKFTNDQVRELSMVFEDGNTMWDPGKDKGIEVEITDSLRNLLQKTIRAADEKGAIPYDPDDPSVKEFAKTILKDGNTKAKSKEVLPESQ